MKIVTSKSLTTAPTLHTQVNLRLFRGLVLSVGVLEWMRGRDACVVVWCLVRKSATQALAKQPVCEHGVAM